MTSTGDGSLFDFDAQAVAAQIIAQTTARATMSPGASAGPGTAPVPVPAQSGTSLLPEQVSAAGLMPDTLTDRGNAKLFVKLYAHDYRHVTGLGWYRWDNTRWQSDDDDTVLWAAGEMAESIATTDPRGIHSDAALRKHRRRALSTSGMNALLVQARSAPGMVLSAGVLDADPYVLCTPAGVVDL
ncbi:DNA primase, partial [Streptomyces sp. NPDC052179]